MNLKFVVQIIYFVVITPHQFQVFSKMYTFYYE